MLWIFRWMLVYITTWIFDIQDNYFLLIFTNANIEKKHTYSHMRECLFTPLLDFWHMWIQMFFINVYDCEYWKMLVYIIIRLLTFLLWLKIQIFSIDIYESKYWKECVNTHIQENACLHRYLIFEIHWICIFSLWYLCIQILKKGMNIHISKILVYVTIWFLTFADSSTNIFCWYLWMLILKNDVNIHI